MGMKSVKEISAIFGVSERTVYRWIEQYPSFPCNRIGNGDYRISASELLTWMRSAPSRAFYIKNRKIDIEMS